jgi:hypothetical protein
MTQPTHPQSSHAIYKFVDVFGSVFFQFLREFHFGPKGLSLIATAAKLEAAGMKSPCGELGGWGAGGLELGLLIFETKTHPATVDITIGSPIRFLQSPRQKRHLQLLRDKVELNAAPIVLKIPIAICLQGKRFLSESCP